MVHHRINEREANPNKHINFVTALPAPEIPPPYSEEDARQLLRALAAQMRPIMKTHGFEVNSFEEVGLALYVCESIGTDSLRSMSTTVCSREETGIMERQSVRRCILLCM